MTESQKRTLRRIAKRCATLGDFASLYAYVDAFDSRPRSPNRPTLEVALAMQRGEAARASGERFGRFLARLRDWWYGR